MKDIKKTLYLGLGLCVKLLAGLYAVKLCAQHLGPDAFGVTGQLSSILAVVTLLAGAGVSAGITKVYAGAEFPRESRPHWLRAARWIALSSAALLLLLILLFADWISKKLFSGTDQAYWILGGLAIGILPIAYASIGQGKINGEHREDLYALSMVVGSVLGLLGLWTLAQYLDATGALLGMIWLIVAQALAMNLLGHNIGNHIQRGEIAKKATPPLILRIKFILNYGILSITAGAIIPIVYIAIRLLIQQHEGDRIFGLWQAALRISEAYTQLPMMLLSVVMFARFAGSSSAPLDKAQVRKTYFFISCMMAGISAFVLLTRDYWIPIVFTEKFKAMEDFVPWQLTGDTLRILSYIGTTILAARGAVKLCILGEFIQGGLLITTNLLLIPKIPVNGAFIAYIASYGLYLPITIFALITQTRQNKF